MRPRWLLLLWLMTAPIQAQPLPVEVPLVPPPAGFTVSVKPVVSPAASPGWEAPVPPCSLCREKPRGARCGCHRYLTQALAEKLMSELHQDIDQVFAGRLVLPGRLTVRVVSAAELRRLGGEPLLGLYENGTVWLSQELTRRRAVAVLAHEYGHAWQYAHRADIDAVSELHFEGFPEWVAFKILQHLGDRGGTRAILDDPSVYGQGARWWLKQEARLGLEATVRNGLSVR